ncbi:MAG: HAD-IA family hydrolase [Lachnospiraceae bacterium]|nr:HAD-IA family hydrolase [Lachnospiraceae bacterium]
MRLILYNFLVNKHAGIAVRYHKMHDDATGAKKIFSWLYLLGLNFAYYVLHVRSIGKKKDAEIYEEKNCIANQAFKGSESELHLKSHPNLSIDAFVEQLAGYDIISFDIFDTLIFRPFSSPTDLFYLLGEKLNIMNFKDIRMQQEWLTRQESYKQYGHYEVTLQEIWKRIEYEVGIVAEKGMYTEQQLELSLCYANHFMHKVFQRLQQMGKTIIIISDMYLSKKFLNRLLRNCGYDGYERLYVSCEYGKNKGTGELFQLVKKDFQADMRFIHVGDNEKSDIKMADRAGFSTLYYPNVNRMALSMRPYDMSAIVGGAYRGIVDNHIYKGDIYSMEYEYGYIYGGLFVLGYCKFIHDYSIRHGIDKLLFLSRDGDILKKVYDYLYPNECNRTEYVYWSRKAATKLMAEEDKHDFFRRFIYHKVNQGYTIADVLKTMELKDTSNIASMELEEELTDNNADILRKHIEENWVKVRGVYISQQSAAKRYYADILSGSSRAVAVDIGWAGSGALALSHLVEKVWNIPCEITGIIAGTNTVHNAEADASEPFLQSGKLVAYLYSQSHNRDILKKHNPNKDYNVFWELLLSSTTPQFSGFYEGRRKKTQDNKKMQVGNKSENSVCDEAVYLSQLDITLQFGKYDVNQEGIREIQTGILDFVREYHEHFKEFPYMFRISGRDAYAPMLVAASHGEKYLKSMEKRFGLEINVN